MAETESATMLLWDTRATERCKGLCMVARPGSTIYDSSFTTDTFKMMPIELMLSFLVRNGRPDDGRSAGWRLDLSNAGQAHEEIDGDFKRPRVLYGDRVFREDKDGRVVRYMIGRLVDGICNAGKQMCMEMGKPHSLNPKRYNEYARELQGFLFAKCSFVESITLQLLDLTEGHSGKEHVDVMNDHRASYDCTMVKVLNFVDSDCHLYSLKIICGYRKRLGDYYSVQMSKIEKILAHARTQLAEVDALYCRLVSNHEGSHHPEVMPTWSNIDPLYIDDHSPWRQILIGETITQEYLPVLTGISRGLWLSAGLSAILELSDKLDESGVIQLLLIMSWQNSFHHFWEVCKRMIMGGGENGEVKKSSFYEYARVARELFYKQGKDKGQEMIGGENPRYGPVGIDFREVFGMEDSPRDGVIENVCGCLVEFLEDVNALGEEEGPITQKRVLEIVTMATARIREKAKCELGSFRLMIFLQGAIFLRVRVMPGPHLRQIFFPVKNSGSWAHLDETGVSENSMEAVCVEIQKELSTRDRFIWMDEVEVILCEAKGGRLLKKFDVIIKGQSLFKLNDVGRSFVKKYGENEWLEVCVGSK